MSRSLSAQALVAVLAVGLGGLGVLQSAPASNPEISGAGSRAAAGEAPRDRTHGDAGRDRRLGYRYPS